MKELSIEEKAKAYDEALERAKECHIDGLSLHQPVKDVIEHIFPELKESEDDQIRKWLIGYFQRNKIAENIKTHDIIAWLEKQGKQKLQGKSALEAADEEKVDNQNCVKPVDKAEPKFKVKYAGSEYNVFETKDIAGVTFYGIEDEPNHIDYVKAENCEIISGYDIKESGLSIPTKPIMFSEQKPTWSEEDERNIQVIDSVLFYDRNLPEDTCMRLRNWLESFRPQNTWKPSDEQLDALHDTAVYVDKSMFPYPKGILMKLYKQLKKLRGE